MVLFKSSNNFKVSFGKNNIIGIPNMNYVKIQRRFIQYLTYQISQLWHIFINVYYDLSLWTVMKTWMQEKKNCCETITFNRLQITQ
jgi:hypothetical protein